MTNEAMKQRVIIQNATVLTMARTSGAHSAGLIANAAVLIENDLLVAVAGQSELAPLIAQWQASIEKQWRSTDVVHTSVQSPNPVTELCRVKG